MPDDALLLWTSAPAEPLDRVGRTATGRAMAVQLLMALGGTNWTIESDAQGKPVACGPLVRHISIAHSRGMVAAAASAVGPIGIDIEYRNPARDLNRLARAAYGAEECRAVAACGLAAFYRIWTVREAISKATGDGMALVADRMDRVPVEMMNGIFVAAGGEWLLAHDVIARDFSLALAAQVAAPKHRSIILQARTLASLRAA